MLMFRLFLPFWVVMFCERLVYEWKRREEGEINLRM
jgi:hypothetical protein